MISQTEGEEFAAPVMPHWNSDGALAALNIELTTFDSADGNCQGFARLVAVAAA